MAFSLTWDEANPVNGTTASNIDDEIRNTRVAVGERMFGMFPNWRTATDRVNISRLFLDSGNLVFRNDTDTTTLATLTNLGQFSTLLGRPAVFCTGGTAPGGGGGFVPFATELIDTSAYHDTAVNNTRLTVPANLAGNYLIVGGGTASLVNDQTGLNTLTFSFRKNNVSNLHSTNLQLRDLSGALPAGALTLIHNVTYITVANLAVADYIEINFTRSATNGTDMTAFYFGMLKLD